MMKEEKNDNSEFICFEELNHKNIAFLLLMLFKNSNITLYFYIDNIITKKY